MLGDPDSCGIWAPCLTYADGLFHLIYTDVKRYGRTTTAGASGSSLRDFHNYLVTSPAHRRRLVRPGLPQQQRLRSVAVPRRRRAEVLAEHALGSRPGREPVRAGSCCRNTRPRAGARRRAAQHLSQGTPLGFTEAPHLYKRDGYYYLLTAEGRHELGSRGDDGALAEAHGPLRAASGDLHPERATSARRRGCSGRATRISSKRRTATTYMVYLCGRPLQEPGPLHAGPRDGHPEDDVGRRTAGCARRTARCLPMRRTPAPELAATRLPRRPGARRLRQRPTCRSISSGCARRGRTSSSA